MDSIISSALEEICSQGQNGISLSSLWSKLNTNNNNNNNALSPSLKSSIYSNLLNISSLQFQSPNKSSPIDANPVSVEDAEKLDLKIVASSQLRDNFVGLYGTSSANSTISSPQRRTLERLAIARSNGITQSQISKEFGIEGNNLFYIVKNLECKGLIVRQPAILRTKEISSEGETKNSSCVSTNLMYLYRYAKHLGAQQRLEISKEGPTLESYRNANENAVSGDGLLGESLKENVHIKDYLPAMKAICDKLEEANGKVLVVADIKLELGYCGTSSGHKSWRNICGRLKDAGIVEEFDAKVNERVERCLRLLRKFSSKNFEPKCGDNLEKEQEVKFGRRLPKTEQLVELPIEHQIYDIVDAEGSDGLAFMEVCDRLGIDKKKSYPRLCSMSCRFGMHLQSENHKRTVAYRVWTPQISTSISSNAFLSKSKAAHGENEISYLDTGIPDDVSHEPAQTFLGYNHSASEGGFATPGKKSNTEIDNMISHRSFGATPGEKNDLEINNELSRHSFREDKTHHMLSCPGNLQHSIDEQSGVAPERDLDLVSAEMETDDGQSKHFALSKPSLNPSVSSTPDSLRRQQRILERLQDEKFILRAEVQKWLADLEDKAKTIDRKTIGRILAKLEQEGHCKCVDINVPLVTNCGRSRITRVVLHPSVQSLTPNVLSEIHDRLRSFEMKIRGSCSSRWKKNEPVPVLDGVQRIQSRLDSDEKAARSETMRANGFVLAKMVRAKLLHKFLWGFLSSSPGWNDALSSEKHVPDLHNLHSSCSLFSLETAFKSIPVELFLQIAGSTQKFDDMIDKCKRGLCLSDLPVQEYRCLMDTQATGRLSLIIDLLRRLKLIRLVSNQHSDDGIKISHANLTHGMELKPYIEEPPSMVATSNFTSPDLRPRIRHDFILSSRDAVDEYWQTLEYCYAAVDPKAALHAFPGSAVHEVFNYRSWASLRVMTAEQRAALLKRIVNDNVHEKLPYKECEKIAKDLNLTLEQVLRVYYDNNYKRLKRFQAASSVNGEECQPLNNKCTSSSQKRKKSLKGRSVKRARVDTVTGQSGGLQVVALPDTSNRFMEDHDLCLASSGEHDFHFLEYQEDAHLEIVEEPGSNAEDENYHSLLSRCAFSKKKPSRTKRFSWTDEADRQLVIQYVRHRAVLGAKFHRTDWASLPHLPSSPSACARRMSSLNRNTKFRKAVMKLCNMLSERYVKHLEETQNRMLNNNDCRLLVRCLSREGLNQTISNGVEHDEDEGFEEKRWDDFDDKTVDSALEDVLRLKRIAKVENLKGSGLVSSTSCSDQNLRTGQSKDGDQRTKCHHLHQKFIKLLSGGTLVSRQVLESLAVSNAIELFKLVFLSNSTAPELQNLLAETLRRYSEHDLFAAFSYLREKKFMIGGNNSPFVLSQLFLHSLSRSSFPVNTGKRAANFSRWLFEREKDLMKGRATLNADLQCGDIFHLFSLVFSGDLSISPRLPDEGVGEAEDLRCTKRRNEDHELYDDDKAKKLKILSESELISRREKGFPGIMVSVRRVSNLVAHGVELTQYQKTCTGVLHGSAVFNTTLGHKNGSSFSQSDYMKENFGGVVPIGGSSNESPWDAMTSYAEYLSKPDLKEQSFFTHQVFKAVYAAIQKAGDQGLSIKEVSDVVDMPGEKISECIIDVLQAFGRALKVNAYDSVRVVDALYRSKYSLTSMAGFRQNLNTSSLTMENHDVDGANSQREVRMNFDDFDSMVHKVTILNLPEDVAEPLNDTQTSNVGEVCMLSDVDLPSGNNEGESYKFSSPELCTPILPWMNGDGTVNSIVYNGLRRRVLGKVMQNPGILEDEIINEMDVLNPQSCKKLLELMVLERHLIVRKMRQTTCSSPPTILKSLVRSSFRNSKIGYRDHFFANPMSACLL